MSNLVRYKRSAAASAILRILADGELMQLVGEGDQAAFGVVYERHTGAALALALRLCGREAVAEDVVQEAFLSLWRSAGGYDPRRGGVRAWVLGIVHHRAIDALRRGVVQERTRVSDEGIAEWLEAAELTEQEFDRRDQARKVRAILEALPPEQSRVIALAYYGGLTHAEIAVMLDTPVGTIKGRMRLGLQKMRSQLRPGERPARAVRGHGARARRAGTGRGR
ncbi:MAG TPA: sigma-70 family RNA polymerase sigma factor [Solirubrobacteraceae bacterium]|nr:sigma-70 family RNA polymerase sigma factor [Solirubrobacteraceae bacterium]